jgi:hypothetical protein
VVGVTAVCPECGETFRGDEGGHAMDYLTDHLTDAHGLFSWATQGRPATEVRN